MKRFELLEVLANRIVAIQLPHPILVAIDGIDAAGKTTLADELVAAIQNRGRHVIRASIDGFHRPRAERYKRGADSPEGYYHDSFDYPAIRSALLLPLGPGGSRRYRRAVFDYRSDSPVSESLCDAPIDGVMLFDGVFLLRPELNDCWDYRVFVDVHFQEAMRRASSRDLDLGSFDAIRTRYLVRYMPGQRIYLETVQPQLRADVIVDNNDPGNPRLTLGKLVAGNQEQLANPRM